MIVLSLFDGISCGQIALKRAGIKVDKYYASEIEPNAIKVTQHNFPNTIQLGDVRNIKAEDLPKIDLLIGGSPCQTFSQAGERTGFDGKSGLFYEFLRLLKEVDPTYFLLENVKMRKDWQDEISRELGVDPVLIDSNLVSAQDRKRLYWTNILGDGWFGEITQPTNKKAYLYNSVEQVDREWLPLLPWTQKYWGGKKKIDMLRTIDSDKSFTLTTNKSHPKNYYLSPDRTRLTKLTSREAEILQTVPEGYTSCISEGAAFSALGNGWTVDVIAHIFKGLLAT
jgi:site-specific DNA-cytosine methylase